MRRALEHVVHLRLGPSDIVAPCDIYPRTIPSRNRCKKHIKRSDTHKTDDPPYTKAKSVIL